MKKGEGFTFIECQQSVEDRNENIKYFSNEFSNVF